MQKNKKSVLIFLMSIVLILAFGGCSDDNNPTNDGISPEILSVYPPNGSTGVSVATPIIIVFSENVDISTFAPSALRPADTSFIISPPTAVNVSYSGDSVFIIPYYNLMFGRDYIITISDYIKDKDGNKLKTAANWTFKTGEEIVPLSANNLWIFYDSLQQIDTINIYDTSYYFFYDTLIDSTFQLDSIVKDSNIELIFLLTDTPSVDPLIIDTLFIDTIWNVFNVSYYDTLIDTTISLEDSLLWLKDTVYNIISPTETTLVIFNIRSTEQINHIARLLSSFNGDSVLFKVVNKYKFVIDSTFDSSGVLQNIDTLLEYGSSNRGYDVFVTKTTNYYHEGDPVFLSQLFSGKFIYRNDANGLNIVGAISQHDTVYTSSLYLKFPVTTGDSWQTIGFKDNPVAGLTFIDQFDIDMECISGDTTFIIPQDTAYTVTGDTVVYEELIIEGCIAYRATFILGYHTYIYTYFYYPNFGPVGYKAWVDYFYVSADTLIDTVINVDTIKIDSFNFDITTEQHIDTVIDTTNNVTPGVWYMRGYYLD